MSNLAEKDCIPCKGGIPPLSPDQIKPLLAQLNGWEVIDDHHLTRIFTFPDFAQALDYVNKIGAVAEKENHHPDIALGWGKVRVDIWTHKINGLTESDFILAAKIDQI